MDRISEIDFIRGISVILMVVFNWSYSLNFLDVYSLIDETNYFYWEVFPHLIASSFLLIVGISLTLSWNRFKQKNTTHSSIIFKYGGRGIFIFVLGLGVTLVTWLFFPGSFIFFGILHLIGLSILFSIPVLNRPVISLITSVSILASSVLLNNLEGSSIVEYSIGMNSVGIGTMDYFPIFPWSGLVFMGIFLGHMFYPDGDRRFEIFNTENRPMIHLIGKYIGRYSLMVYLVHQPFLILLMVLMGIRVF